MKIRPYTVTVVGSVIGIAAIWLDFPDKVYGFGVGVFLGSIAVQLLALRETLNPD